MRKRIAVVGAGVSGLVCARILSAAHDVDLFEAGARLGGHALTLDASAYGRRFAVDVGFMVFNRRTYPQFCRLLSMLEIESQPSDMSFSVRADGANLEYQGSSLGGLFAQRRNLARPRFWRMLRDVIRFNREAGRLAQELPESTTLGAFVRSRGYGEEFRRHYLLPMTAAIWSSPTACVEEFPAVFLLRFLQNHGLVQLSDRPQWFTIPGGSQRYVAALAGPLMDRVRLNCPIERVRRTRAGVLVKPCDGEEELFDAVVLAGHAPDSLAILEDATPLERRVLGAFAYQRNEAAVHTDRSLLPRRERAWASWNYLVSEDAERPPAVTYDLNRLQRLGAPGPICVTLNPPHPPAPEQTLAKLSFSHPLYSTAAWSAQTRREELHGDGRVYFCGAYWGHGFHEDGVASALAVCRRFNLGFVPKQEGNSPPSAATLAASKAHSPATGAGSFDH